MKGSLLGVSLYLIASGILVQAWLAGLFISMHLRGQDDPPGRWSVLPYLAIVPVASAWRRANESITPRYVTVGSTLLLIGLWVQEALGHMPFPETTVIHVPLGVALFGLALHLATRPARPR